MNMSVVKKSKTSILLRFSGDDRFFFGGGGGVILSAYFTIPVDILRVEPNLNWHDVEMKGTVLLICVGLGVLWPG